MNWLFLGPYFGIAIVSTEMVQTHVFLVTKANKFQLNMFGLCAIQQTTYKSCLLKAYRGILALSPNCHNFGPIFSSTAHALC